MAAGHDMGGTVLDRELVERPHDADLPFGAGHADRVDPVVAMQALGVLAGANLDAGAAADLVVDAVRQQDRIGHLHHVGMTD